MMFSRNAIAFALSTLCVSRMTLAQNCPSLMWSDEFDGSALDASAWTPQEGDGCDLGQNLCGWGNNEPQYYSSNNIEVSDGTLKIIAKRESIGGKEFTSARIRTFGTVEVDLTKETLIEARIKVPDGGKGLWPAFWLMPSPEVLWPTGGEIDIMEFIGREPYFGQAYVHYGNIFRDKSEAGGAMRFPEPVFEDFHVFSMHKTSNRISFMIDGHEYQTITPEDIEPKYSWPFENTYYMILNVAAGGNWPGYADDSTTFPTTMEVDYVRVYEMVDGKTVPLINGIRLVHQNDKEVEYCVVNGNGGEITWEVPGDATLVPSSNPDCILVDFGTASGYVKASIASTCIPEEFYMVSIPVEVQPYYGVESSIMDPTTPLPFATGDITVVDMEGEQVLMYTRSSAELYDNIQIDTSVTNSSDFLMGNKKFYFDVKTTTSAPCTRVYVQLEDSAQIIADDDFTGRHSRYQCLLESSTDWQRVACDYVDEPDPSVTTIDRVVILIDPLLSRGDVYYFRSLDVVAAGCTTDCEDLPINGASTTKCNTPTHSEAGACNDGINNDSEGYAGNDVTDCADPACFMIDPVCIAADSTGTAVPATSPPSITPLEDGASPAPTVTSPPSIAPLEDGASPAPTASLVGATTGDTAQGESLAPTTSPAPSASIFGGPAECASNDACVGLVENCCPTMDGVYLYCCFEEPLDFGYEKEFTFVGPQVEGERATYRGSNSPYFVPATAPDDSTPVVSYDRGDVEVFDLIYYDTEAITNAFDYVSGNKTFYLDVFTTSSQCTQILIQLDSLPMAEENEYPTGRHSRYVAFTTKTNEWERLQFKFLDRPDETLGDDMVNAIVLFFDVGTLKVGTYYFRNLDSAIFGCDPTVSSACEISEPKSCPALFDGELCTDGIDNDSDGLTDCEDMECMEDPSCLETVSRSYSTVTNLLSVPEGANGSGAMSKGVFLALAAMLAAMVFGH